MKIAALLGATFAALAAAKGQLLGFAIQNANELYETVAVASIDAAAGSVHYTHTSRIPPSVAFCNVAFDADRRVYYVPSGKATLLTVDAISGNITHTATLSTLYDLPATQWDESSGLLLALGMPGGRRRCLLGTAPDREPPST
jgi:hypothetical protein